MRNTAKREKCDTSGKDCGRDRYNCYNLPEKCLIPVSGVFEKCEIKKLSNGQRKGLTNGKKCDIIYLIQFGGYGNEFS